MTAATSYTDQPELGGFDEASTEIVLTAIGDGWTARRSKRGHMIMRAPDGRTTTSISRDLGSKRRERENAWAPIRRYQKQMANGGSSVVEVDYKCPQCEYTGADKRSLAGHQAMNHGVTQVCEYGCGRTFHTKASYALHIKSHVRKIEAEAAALAKNPPPVEVEEKEEPLVIPVPAPALTVVKPEETLVATSPVEKTIAVTPVEGITLVEDLKSLPTEVLTSRIADALAATYQLKAILDAVAGVPALVQELTRRHGEAEASLALMGELFDSIRGK